MKYILCLSLPLLWFNSFFSQSPYNAGLKKVVFYNDTVNYEFMEYEGPLPFFCYIWYPTEETPDSNFKVEDYFQRELSDPSLKNIHDTVIENYRGTIKYYGIQERVGSFREVKFKRKQKKCFDAVLRLKHPVAINAKPVQKKFPLVIYHHGAGGTAEENSYLCEMLARNGYVVVSSNFHWPIIGKYWGAMLESTYSVQDVIHVKNEMKKLSEFELGNTYYIGHSAGAQIGILTNADKNRHFDLFISFDTTLESADSARTYRSWPYMCKIKDSLAHRITTPTIFITAKNSRARKKWSLRGMWVGPRWYYFNQLHHTPRILTCYDGPLQHNCFTYQGIMRGFIDSSNPTGEKKDIRMTKIAYLEVMNYALSALNHAESGKDISSLSKTSNFTEKHIPAAN